MCFIALCHCPNPSDNIGGIVSNDGCHLWDTNNGTKIGLQSLDYKPITQV